MPWLPATLAFQQSMGWGEVGWEGDTPGVSCTRLCFGLAVEPQGQAGAPVTRWGVGSFSSDKCDRSGHASVLLRGLTGLRRSSCQEGRVPRSGQGRCPVEFGSLSCPEPQMAGVSQAGRSRLSTPPSTTRGRTGGKGIPSARSRDPGGRRPQAQGSMGWPSVPAPCVTLHGGVGEAERLTSLLASRKWGERTSPHPHLGPPCGSPFQYEASPTY